MPAPHSSRPSADTDQLLTWVFGLALGLLVLIRVWPDSPLPAPAPVVEEAAPFPPPTPSEWKDQTPPAGQQWENPADSAAWARSQPAAPAAATDWDGPAPTAPAADDDRVYTEVEQMPEPPGGQPGLEKYLRDNVKYPAEARHRGVTGKVLVGFIVGADGQIRDAHVAESLGAGCDKEAVQVISRMPAWTPGQQYGRTVSVSVTVPVTFPPNW